jgi:hypothetical protein
MARFKVSVTDQPEGLGNPVALNCPPDGTQSAPAQEPTALKSTPPAEPAALKSTSCVNSNELAPTAGGTPVSPLAD